MSRDEDFRSFALGQSLGLRRLSYALTQDRHRAEDLLQATLERTYLKWARVAGAEDPGAYVRSICYRLAATERSRGWRRFESTFAEPPELVDSPQEDVENRLDLARALSGLTVKQRAVVVLRYLEDRPVREVAHILNVSEGTVKRQTFEAVRRLRTLLPATADKNTEAPHA